MSSEARLRAVFSLPARSRLLDSFRCALLDDSLPYQGRLHVFSHHVAFHSSLIPLQTQRLLIPLSAVEAVSESRLLLLDTGLTLRTRERSYAFASFINRDKCIQLIRQALAARQAAAAAGDEAEEEDGGQDCEDEAEERTSEDGEAPRQDSAARSRSSDDAGKGEEEEKRRQQQPDDGDWQLVAAETKSGKRGGAVSSRKGAGEGRGRGGNGLRASPRGGRHEGDRAATSARARKGARLAAGGRSREAKTGEEECRESGDEQREREEETAGAASLPPQPALLYAPRSYSLADPAVSAVAARISSLSSPLDTRNRRLLQSGFVLRQGRFSVVRRQMLLLTDLLILCKLRRGGGLQLKQQMQLDGLTLDIRPMQAQAADQPALPSSYSSTRLPDPFRIVCPARSSRRPVSYLLSAEGGEDSRREWLRSIQLAVSRLQWSRCKAEGKSLQWGWYLRIVRGSLHLAVLEDREEEVRDILSRRQQRVDDRDQEGLSPLMVAAHVNRHALVQLLLSCGADVALRDADGRTALHIAAKLGHGDSVQALLQDERVVCSLYHPKSGRLSTRSAIWMSALAHQAEYERCCRLLVRHCEQHRWPSSSSPVLDARDLQGRTLLELCVSLSLTDVIPLLVALGATLDLVSPSSHSTALCLAAQQKDMDSLVTLIQLGAQPNCRDADAGTAALHFASSLEVASFLVAHGARMGMRSRDGVRVTDVYADEAQLQTLLQAEALYQQRKPVETADRRLGRPRSVEANGGHALDSCAICQDGLGGLAGVVKKAGWCARCGRLMCSSCLSQQLIFSSAEEGGEESVAAVCSGCYNLSMYAAETSERRDKRRLRQRREAERARQSVFNLEYISDVLTAVHLSQHSLQQPANAVMTYHGLTQLAEQPQQQSSAAGSSGGSGSPASGSSPARSSPAARRSRPAAAIGPAANARLAGKEPKVINYTAGDVRAVQRSGPQLALNNAPAIDSDSSPGRPSPLGGDGSSRRKAAGSAVAGRRGAAEAAGGGGSAGLTVSVSMDGVSERHGKRGTRGGGGQQQAVREQAEAEAAAEAVALATAGLADTGDAEAAASSRRRGKAKPSPSAAADDAEAEQEAAVSSSWRQQTTSVRRKGKLTRAASEADT